MAFDIENLTLKEIKEIAVIAASFGAIPATTTVPPFIGRYCIVRTYSAGVHIGTLKSRGDTTAILTNARRLHYWAGAASLSQVAVDGLPERSDTRFSVSVPEIEVDGVIEIIPATDAATKNLKSYKEWKV